MRTLVDHIINTSSFVYNENVDGALSSIIEFCSEPSEAMDLGTEVEDTLKYMLECVPTVDTLNLDIFVGIHDEALEKLSSLADVRRHVAEALVPCLKNRGTFMSENTLCFVQLAREWATSSKQQECCVSVEAMIRTTARTIVPTLLPMSLQPFIKALAVGRLEYTLLQECHPNSPSMLKAQDVATTFGTVLQAIAAMKKTL
jgi:hypothetical protein